MTAGQVVGYVLGGLSLLIGVASTAAALREEVETETGRERVLVAMHQAARAAFWLALGAFFIGYEIVEEPQTFRWFAFVPLGMAGIRLATAAFLWRR